MIETKNSKITYLGEGKYRLECFGFPVQMRENGGAWQDIDLTIRDGKMTAAPYEFTVVGSKLIFKDKQTGEVSTLELLDVKPTGVKWQVIPHNEGVSFQHILPSGKIPFEAKFKIIGNAHLITRTFDDAGDLEMETTFKDGVLTERLSGVKDKLTGLSRTAVGNIRIDPTLTVQPSAKDTFLNEDAATTNYGNLTFLAVREAYPGYNEVMRSALEFGISALPGGAILSSATLQLYYYALYNLTDGVGKTIWAYKQTHPDWVELEATWNIYKTGSNWTATGGDYVTSNPAGGSTTVPASYSWMSWNVLAIVQDAYDGSIAAEFLMRFATESVASDVRSNPRWYSREYTTDTSLCPKLVIEYTVEANVTVTPGVIVLSDTEYIPVLKEVTTPTTLALSSTKYASILGTGVIPSALALSLALNNSITGYGYIPTTLAHTLTKYIPVLEEVTTPTSASLTLSAFMPVLGFTIIPSILVLVDTEYAPALDFGVIPGILSLILTKYVPIISQIRAIRKRNYYIEAPLTGQFFMIGFVDGQEGVIFEDK